MKANELSCKDVMVGDWVDVRNNAAPNTPHLERITPSHFLRDEHWYGVELVPEILEKNGMHLYNSKTNSFMEWCNHSDCFKEDENYMVELSLDNDGKIRWTINGDEYTIMPLDYVHQLQQALRLCGIEKEIVL